MSEKKAATEANKRHSSPDSQDAPQKIDSLFDGVADLWLRFDRFGWDIVGVISITLAVISFFGLSGLTHGVLISPWVQFLRRWLGWGSLIIVALFVWLGVFALRKHRVKKPIRMRLDYILALEAWAFVILTLLAIWGGRELERAQNGLDGGLIGWGLAGWVEGFLPPPFGSVVLIVLLVFLPLYGFGIMQLLVRGFERWLFRPDQADEVSDEVPAFLIQETPSDVSVAEAAAPQEQKTLAKPLPMIREEAKMAVSLRRDTSLPPLNLLSHEQPTRPDEVNIHETATIIEKTLMDFGVPARVTGFRVGPTVTQFAVEPGFIDRIGPDGTPVRQKVRVSQISALARDLALALSAEKLRIEAPVPGHSFVGIEVPNPEGAMVRLRPLLESEAFQRLASPLALALGKDVSGLPVVADLIRMPHLLIAGTTGSGKSVCISAIITCLVMNNRPSDLRLALLDPKMVELVRFNGLPHLLGKVESKPERMIGVLNWALAEMDQRYRLLEAERARDLENYNRRMLRRKKEVLPRIVLIIDELADLMMSAPDQTEHSLVRLAQLARATGIHLVVATQRPSTEVVTGLIKANFPARISFTVASSVDSRVILDGNGAETLLGRGDMLFLNPEVGTPQRAQGVMVSDQEILRVISFWKKLLPAEEAPSPWEEVLRNQEEGPDQLLNQAISVVRQARHASTSLLQRRLRIGYPRAARLIDELEELGVVGPSQGGGREREVLLPPEDEEEEGHYA
ncbi:MAG: DNA translocase FtsK [Anaerolineae bacterium]|nr:DNA translocase FtsK [Anaerolineae bacterium]